MKSALTGVGVFVVAAVFLEAMLFLDPFNWSIGALDSWLGTGVQSATQVMTVVDPLSSEASHGEHPRASFDRVSAAWNGSTLPRVYLIGNSQTYFISYAPGERRSGVPERAYPDLLFERYRESRERRVLGYLTGVPNLGMIEALWYVRYLTQKPALHPTAVVLQVNYETFRKTGVRDGMLDLLSEADFRAAIEGLAGGSAAFAGSLARALGRREELLANEARQSRAGDESTLLRSPGPAVERTVRRWLERVPGFKERWALKGTFLNLLYRLRVYALRITPTTRRSIGGAPLEENASALDAIARLCKESGIGLVLFEAPQNPAAPLYRTEEDRRRYRESVATVVRRYGLEYYDFENSIPRGEWGVWIDGPDPIHMGHAGHRRLATVMLQAGVVDHALENAGAAAGVTRRGATSATLAGDDSVPTRTAIPELR